MSIVSVNVFKNGEIKQIAGNAKEAPPIDITPESIGAIAKTGDTMTGLLRLERGSTCYQINPGYYGSTVFYCFGRVAITGAYVSNPLIIELSMRGHDHTSVITFAPTDMANLNTNVRVFTYEGSDIDAYTWREEGNGIVYFPLYIRLNPYQTMSINRVGGAINGYCFEKTENALTELPQNAIKASRIVSANDYKEVQGGISSVYSSLYAHRIGSLIILEGSLYRNYPAAGVVYEDVGYLNIDSLLYAGEELKGLSSTLQGISINATGTALANPNIITTVERESGSEKFRFKSISDTAGYFHHRFSVMYAAIR